MSNKLRRVDSQSITGKNSASEVPARSVAREFRVSAGKSRTDPASERFSDLERKLRAEIGPERIHSMQFLYQNLSESHNALTQSGPQ